MVQLKTHDGYPLWHYLPSPAGSGIFIALYAVMIALYAWRMFKNFDKIAIPFIIGVLFEFSGYCTRAAAYSRTDKLTPYIIQSFYLLLGPALFAASIYMSLGQIIRQTRCEKYSPINVRWLTKVFVGGDLLSFLIQGGASGLMFKPSTQKIGQALIVIGLFAQLISFALFCLVAIVFHKRMRRSGIDAQDISIQWQKLLSALYAVSALIILRSVFRIVEYILGNSGYPMEHEWTLYIFDSVPMFVVAVIYLFGYLGFSQEHGLQMNRRVSLGVTHEDVHSSSKA